MRKRIVTTSAVIAGLLLVGGGTAIAVTNSNNAVPVSEKSDKVVSVPVVEHANTEAKSSSASPSPSPSASEKAVAEAIVNGTATTNAAPVAGGSSAVAPVQSGTENTGTRVAAPSPRYENIPTGTNPYVTYDPSQADATATSGTTTYDPSQSQTSSDLSQVTVTYPGQ